MKSISIIIPTLNSGKVLEKCLQSINIQNYPKDKIEIIIIDAGSIDNTIEIASKYNVTKILGNPLKTGEAGKAVGAKAAKNEILAFVDSDNILDGTDWIFKMLEPFNDDEIIASEPLYYTYRKEDGYITRYCALLGMNDPICLFLGNYDRYCYITGKWTEMPVLSLEDKDRYLKLELEPKKLPTIGANGFLVRREALLKCDYSDYLFDIDIVSELITMNHLINGSLCKKIAKVKTGIVHTFSGNMSTFARKQKRRIRDFKHFSGTNQRKYPWKKLNKLAILKFILYTVLIFPLLFQMVKGFIRKRDLAWFFHIPACWITLWVYSTGTLLSKSKQSLTRDKWSQ